MLSGTLFHQTSFVDQLFFDYIFFLHYIETEITLVLTLNSKTLI